MCLCVCSYRIFYIYTNNPINTKSTLILVFFLDSEYVCTDTHHWFDIECSFPLVFLSLCVCLNLFTQLCFYLWGEKRKFFFFILQYFLCVCVCLNWVSSNIFFLVSGIFEILFFLFSSILILLYKCSITTTTTTVTVTATELTEQQQQQFKLNSVV